MKLPIKHEMSVKNILNSASIEKLRYDFMARIEVNESFSEDQKDAMVQELDFLLQFEKYRRMLRMIYLIKEEKREYENRIYEQQRLRRVNVYKARQELKHETALNRKETALKIAKLNEEIANCKMTVLERLDKIGSHAPIDKDLRKAKGELNRIKLQSKLRRTLQDEAEKELRDRVIRKAQFQKQVKQQFPDMEEELMDEYDRQMYNSEQSEK